MPINLPRISGNVKAAFKVGDNYGPWLIVEYRGHASDHPITGHHYAKAHHWYLARCECGALEIRSQQQVKNATQGCTDCLSAYRSNPDNKRVPRQQPVETVPDFARLKW